MKLFQSAIFRAVCAIIVGILLLEDPSVADDSHWRNILCNRTNILYCLPLHKEAVRVGERVVRPRRQQGITHSTGIPYRGRR